MIKEIGYYSLIQFCPDPVASEVINIGMVAFCPQTGFVDVRVSPNNNRIIRMFGSKVCYEKTLQRYKEELRESILEEPSQFDSLENARKFIAEQVNQVIFTEPRPTVWLGGAKEGSLQLFKRLFQDNISQNRTNRLARYFPKQKIIRKLKENLGLQFSQKIVTDLPKLQIVDKDNTVAPLFGFQNGHFNAVFAKSFTQKNYAFEIIQSMFIADTLKNNNYPYIDTRPIFLCRITDSVEPKIPIIKEHFEQHNVEYFDNESVLIDYVSKSALDDEKITAKNSDNVSIVTSQCHTASLYEYGTEKEPALAGVVEGSEDEEN